MGRVIEFNAFIAGDTADIIRILSREMGVSTPAVLSALVHRGAKSLGYRILDDRGRPIDFRDNAEFERSLARFRSKGICEVRIQCPGDKASHFHHILPRILTRGVNDRHENLLHVCPDDHYWIHTPANKDRAIDMGWLRDA